MSDKEPTTLSLLKLLAPFLLLTAAVTVALVLLLLRLTPVGGMATKPVVASFDVIKYTNSQRAVASTFLKPTADITRANELLLKLPERTRQAIADIAGAGTLVVVKQAVVQGQTADITDAVLGKLGLPTNVPTADATAYSLDVAPTMLGSPPPKKTHEEAPASSGAQVLP